MTDYKIQPVRCKLVNDGAAIRRAPLSHVTCGEDAARLLTWYYKREALPNERLVAVLLTAGNQVRGISRLSEGGLHSASVSMSDILRPIIAGGVSSFIMAHNHPSGNPTPSAADIDLTKLTVEAARVVGLSLLDHFVVGGDLCVSIAAFLGKSNLEE
jgi:DNA repair protein RadC